MVINELKNLFNENGIVKFELYGLEYTIEKLGDTVIIYPSLYNQRNVSYNSLEELLNNHLIYNETIIDNQNQISKIYV